MNEASREKRRLAARQWRADNPERVRANNKAHYERNKTAETERHFWYWMRRAYGVSREQYEAMLVAQNSRCAICQATVLGLFDDSVERLLAAIEYLKRHAS